MKTVRYCAILLFFVAVCAALTFADEAETYPAYLHALSDLRDARTYLDRLTPSDRLDNEQEHAIRGIDAAISEIKPAAINDGEGLPEPTPVDAHLGREGRYHKALELLDRAHRDIAEKQDSQFATGSQYLALEDINEARRIVDRLIILASNGVINVKTYGATGNSITDDTAAINKAIAAISPSKPILYFPAGTYMVSSTLSLAYPVHVLGDSQTSTIIYLANNSN
jgi:tetratricopeptide (TPR) repeat protein